MFLTKRYLSRRTFIRSSVGAALGLPLLDAMVPAQTPLAGTAAAPVARFGFIYTPMGAIMNQWTPQEEGRGFALSPVLQPLQPFRDRLSVFTGLRNPGEPGHSVSSATFISGTAPHKGNVLLLNTTADQLIAQKIGQQTIFPSMEFATEDKSASLGSCAGDYLCAYMSTICWRSETQPLPMEINPRVVFERMFGSDAATPEARRLRARLNGSILDGINESLNEITRSVGPQDRIKLDAFLDTVREVERRIEQGEKTRNERAIEAPETPVGIPESFEAHVNLMFDLQALALQTDMTRVISFMMAAELSNLSYPQLGVADAHHPVSHNNGVPEQVAKKAKIDSYHLQLFARFLKKLEDTREGDSNLLQNSLFLYGSGMSNGNQHIHTNLPILLVGGAAGKVRGDRHIRVKDQAPLSNLVVGILHAAGVATDKYAESTGAIEL